MATGHTRNRWTVDELLAAVRDLPPGELSEFQRHLSHLCRRHNGNAAESAVNSDEENQIAQIRKLSTLPAAEQRRFNKLRRKNQSTRLTEAETHELQSLWQRVEQMNADRLAVLAVLAKRRHTNVKNLIKELGLSEYSNAR
jgi:hypothetical protein